MHAEVCIVSLYDGMQPGTGAIPAASTGSLQTSAIFTTPSAGAATEQGSAVTAWQLSLLLFGWELPASRMSRCAACDADAVMAVWGAATSTAAAAAMLLRAALLAFLASLLNAFCSLCLDFAAAA